MNTATPMKNRRGSSRPAAGGSTTSWLLATALPVCLGLLPLQAAAVPDEVGGNASTANVIAPAGVWTPLRSVPVLNGNQRRFCIATCSADMENTGAPFQSTLFDLTLNAPPPIPTSNGTPCERTLQFANPGDVRIKEITTTCGPFLTGPGTNNFLRCWARPVIGAAAQTILDSSMTVVCTDTRTEAVP